MCVGTVQLYNEHQSIKKSYFAKALLRQILKAAKPGHRWGKYGQGKKGWWG